MRITSLLRLTCALLLLGAMSSFSGCEKTNVGPRSCTKPATTTATTTTGTTTPSPSN